MKRKYILVEETEDGDGNVIDVKRRNIYFNKDAIVLDSSHMEPFYWPNDILCEVLTFLSNKEAYHLILSAKNKRLYEQAQKLQKVNRFALSQACIKGHVDLLKRCLNEPSINFQEVLHGDLICKLIKSGNTDLMSLILETDRYDPFAHHGEPFSRESAFLIAISYQSSKMLQLMLEHRNLTKIHLISAFHSAAENKKFKSAKIIISSLQWKKLVSYKQNRQLFEKYALRKNDIIVCLALQMDLKSSKDLLSMAIKNKHPELIQAVIKDPSTDLTEATVQSCNSGDLSLVECMVKTGRVDLTYSNNIILRTAAMKDWYSLIDTLLKDPKVDPSVWDNDAWRVASEFKHRRVLELLEKDSRVQKEEHNKLIRNNVFTGIPSATILNACREKGIIDETQYQYMRGIRNGKSGNEDKTSEINKRIIVQCCLQGKVVCHGCQRHVTVQITKTNTKGNRGKLFYSCKSCKRFSWI